MAWFGRESSKMEGPAGGRGEGGDCLEENFTANVNFT